MRNTKAVSIACILLIWAAVLSIARDADGKSIAKYSIETFTGTVSSISIADKKKGTRSEIIVTDAKSGKKVFLITATTTLYGIKSAPLTLDKIRKDNKVKVKYRTTKEGIDEAVSVRIEP